MPANHTIDKEDKLCSVLNLLGLFRLQGMTEDGLKSLCLCLCLHVIQHI